MKNTLEKTRNKVYSLKNKIDENQRCSQLKDLLDSKFTKIKDKEDEDWTLSVYEKQGLGLYVYVDEINKDVKCLTSLDKAVTMFENRKMEIEENEKN